MALRLAIDTNRYRDIAYGELSEPNPLRFADEVFLPFVVAAELRAGFRIGSKRDKNEAILADFIRSFRVRMLFPDEGTTHYYADLVVTLRKLGKPAPTNGLWIAALAIQHDLTLFTRDKHFENIPRLARM